MKIKFEEITVRELIEGYVDDADKGIRGYDGNLNIRPAYQREFVYKDKQRNSVIETVNKGFPLNTMYWVDNEDGTYEILDGQQRSISICQYVNGDFSLNYKFFHNLNEDEQNLILDYKLMVFICTGSHTDKLDWFRVINIAGEKLSVQELRNITYIGKWLSDAKMHFSKTNCVASNLAKKYIKGSPIRQEFLQTALDWISEGNIEDYMSKHQRDNDAAALWIYFQSVINWVKIYFPNYRSEMKGLPWGRLYNEFKDEELDKEAIEKTITRLMKDEDVTKKAGIYQYILLNEEKYLSIRAFNQVQKREVYETQGGTCAECDGAFDIEKMEADHIIPWSKGGKTNKDNCQMLCVKCNRKKSNH